MPEISYLYENDNDRYEAIVREWTRKYAMGEYICPYDENRTVCWLLKVDNINNHNDNTSNTSPYFPSGDMIITINMTVKLGKFLIINDNNDNDKNFNVNNNDNY
ncbi:hypothetical protein RIR_e7232_A0A2I1FAI6_9GLOM [Rhizophagus irregularis DAOM 181602=DAOM 197198]|nr:hypothetical protein RIR_e7232_A0A2I1FAI6_9GLOM [Rhizophagus irregularis DAOM 181602=DAOM 197198]